MARLKYFTSVTQKISEKYYDISYIYKIFLNKLWTVPEWSRLNLKQITARNEKIHI